MPDGNRSEVGEFLPGHTFGGRPCKYRDEMCDTIIRMGKEGASRTQMQVEIGISKDAWHDWINPESPRYNPRFSDAVKEALALSQSWWEQKGQEKTFNDASFNATSYIFQMKNRFKEDWADRHVQENTGSISIQWSKGE